MISHQKPCFNVIFHIFFQDYNSSSAVSEQTTIEAPATTQETETKQSLQQQQLEAAAEEMQNQADVDSEVSQINTQPKVSETSSDYVRPQSRSTSSAVRCVFFSKFL